MAKAERSLLLQLCEDCRWHIPGKGPFADDPRWALCGHASAEQRIKSQKDGLERVIQRTCAPMRDERGPCGPEGKFWQPSGGFV